MQRHQRRGAIGYVAFVGMEIAAVAWVVRALIAPLVDGSAALAQPSISMSMLLVAILIAPLCEILLFQGIPIELVLLLSGSSKAALGLSTAAFLVCHLMAGFGTGLSAGLVGGLYLSSTYLHWKKRSRCAAVAVTVGTHVTANVTIVAALLALGDVSYG
jgi:hypothetical protein